MSDALTFYAAHSPITDPGVYQAHFHDLSRDLPTLHQITQNLYIHIWKIRKYHQAWLKGRTHEYESRTVSKSLALVLAHNDHPLTVERQKQHKLIVDCRHFATLLCSLLRSQGIPARVRCGFATYLEKTHYQDHWICEYWNGERWVMEDPDLKMHDVSPEQFITGGRAWQMVRAGEISDVQFGYEPHVRGQWTIRQDTIRDLAAINGFEMLSSDNWGLILKDEPLINAKDRKLLDEAARWTLAGNHQFADMQNFYQSQESLHVPETIKLFNYINNQWSTISWDDRP